MFAMESGQLTFNISSLEINENETRMQIDLRIPVTVDRDKLLAKLSKQVAALRFKSMFILIIWHHCTFPKIVN